MRISLKHWLRLRRDPWRIVFYDNFKRWKRDKMEPKRMQFEGLSSSSVVFDVGGFEGNWAQDVFDRYGATLHVFEPHPDFAAALNTRFAANDAITVHDFALGSAEGTLSLSDDGDASSAFVADGTGKTGRVADVGAFLDDFAPERIHLMKVNIEGGEYDLLPALAASGHLHRIDVLQVQFHLYGEEFIAKRDAIIEELKKTHCPAWTYPFVWEEWHRLPSER
ncbi:MAG: FkbM family methyltransferase [Pseudomonadota bacterium]